ncbi:MAG TPA: peptidylprolyl isomerase [Chitinophagales bacterium]|nr:peptidylprolyl isomerase [Chitinophagales bacterium]
MKKLIYLLVGLVLMASFTNKAGHAKTKKKKMEPGLYAEFETTKGNITCRLEYQKAPVTVANFVGLAEGKIKNTALPEGKRFYDGLIFHRCIHNPPFMIQGGDPQGTGMGGSGYYFNDEFDMSLNFNGPGMLAMANSGRNTNSSQFFITEAPTTWLNYKHSIFGTVVDGLPLVSQINNGDTIKKVNIIRVGKEAKEFDEVAVWAKKDELLKAKADEFASQKADVDAGKTMSADDFVKKNYPNAVKTPSGLYYVVEKEGTGPRAEPGKKVSVHYTGRLTDGSKFDSSYDRNQPITFTLGIGQVIKGWDEGIALMSVGSKYKLIIPYQLAYGENGHPPVIPAKATLVFDTELVGIQ